MTPIPLAILVNKMYYSTFIPLCCEFSYLTGQMLLMFCNSAALTVVPAARYIVGIGSSFSVNLNGYR